LKHGTTIGNPPLEMLPDLRGAAAGERLVNWLLDAGVVREASSRILEARRVSDGFSYETWIVTLVADKVEQALIIRRQPLFGVLAPYDIAPEAGLLAALARTDVPAPALLGYCQDNAVLGAPFLAVEYIAGEVPDYRLLPEFPPWQDPSERRRLGEKFFQLLGRVQAVEWRSLAPDWRPPDTLSDRPADPVLKLLKGVIADRVGSRWTILPEFVEAGAWLSAHQPSLPIEEQVLVHGDYKVGNFIWRDDQIVALLDWEMTTVGDPMRDLGYACHPIMRERFPELMSLLLPLPDLMATYEQATGRAVELKRLHFYVIFALYFHAFTVLTGLISVADEGTDFRLAPMYAKLQQVTRHLITEINKFERGQHVL